MVQAIDPGFDIGYRPPGFDPQRTYPEDPNLKKISGNGALIDTLYKNLLGHPADPTGRAYWMGQLTSGQLTPQNIGGAITTAAKEYEPGGVKFKGSIFDPSTIKDPTTGGMADIFQPGKFPYSRTTSGGQQVSGSTQFAGLPGQFPTQLLEKLIPQLLGAVKGLPGTIEQYTTGATDLAQQAGRKFMEQSLTPLLNQLASRNILQSSITGNVMGDVAGRAAEQVQGLGYQAGMRGAEMAYGMPGMLGQLAGLGQVSRGVSGGIGTQYTQAEQADPLAPYKLLSNFMTGGY